MMPNIKSSILSFTMTFICLFLSGGPAQAQNGPYIDSISNIVESQEGTVQVASYRRMFQAAIRINPEIAKEYVDSSKSKSIQLNHKGLTASTSSDYGVYLNYIADYEEAIIEYDKAIKIFEELGDKDQESMTLNNKGLTLGAMGRFREELETHIKSLKIKETLKLEDQYNDGADYWDETIAASYWSIGSVHGRLNNIEKSNEYYYLALDIYDRLGLIDDAEQLKENLAINHYDLGDYAKAISMYKKGIAYLTTNNYFTSLAIMYGNLTRAYIKVDSLDEAKEAILKALALKDKHNDITLHGLHLRYDGDIMMKRKKYQKALSNYKQALSIAKDADTKSSMVTGYLKVSDAYSALGNHKMAYENLSKYRELHEDVLGKENMAKINELEILYQTERKEKDLIIEKDKVELLEKEAKVSLLQRWLLALGLLVALGALFFGWYSFRQKSKLAQKEKEKLDAELEFKKKELTTHALHLAKKNELLEGLKNKAQALRNESEEKSGYRQLIRTIDFDLNDEDNWENFASYFQQVHKDFNQNVVHRYPEVTSNDLRLISLVKMNLSIKEMANILNISVPGVKKARQRLRKKMNLETKDSLELAVLEI